MQKPLGKLKSLSKDDLKRQKMFIHLSLSPAGEEILDRKSPFGTFRRLIETDYQKIDKEQIHESEAKKEWIYAAKRIADKLADEAILDDEHDEHDEIGWFSYRVMNRKTAGWSIQPCNVYLYDGIAGIAIFFHRFLQNSKEEKYCKICRMLDGQLFRHTDLMEHKVQENRYSHSGLFTGKSYIRQLWKTNAMIC